MAESTNCFEKITLSETMLVAMEPAMKRTIETMAYRDSFPGFMVSPQTIIRRIVESDPQYQRVKLELHTELKSVE